MGKKIEHFFLMDKRARNVVRLWVDDAKPNTEKQKTFVADVRRALYVTNYDYYILMHELVSKWNDGKVIANSECASWEGFAKGYYNKDGLHSELANKDEVFLWYAFRVAYDLWDLEGVCEKKLFYSTGPYKVNYSGMTYCGGFCDGIGNTPKLIKYYDSLAILGDIYPENGSNSAIDIRIVMHSKNIYPFCTGILVIKE